MYPSCLPISLTAWITSSGIGTGFHFGVGNSYFVKSLNTE